VKDHTHRQFQLALMCAQWWLTSVASGHYKQRGLQRGAGKNPDGTIEFRDCTDEEKLDDAMECAKRHMEFATKCSERLAESEPR